MSEITITSFHRLGNPRPTKAGHAILAYLGFEAHGIAFMRWAFVRTAKGDLQVWSPLTDDVSGKTNACVILDRDFRAALNEKAKDAFRAFGGFIAEDAAA